MKKILLISIHPKFVEKILTGEKRLNFGNIFLHAKFLTFSFMRQRQKNA